MVNGRSPDTAAIQAVKDVVQDYIADKPHLQLFCSDDCILRFLRARNMDSQKAARMLTETLHWYANEISTHTRFQFVKQCRRHFVRARCVFASCCVSEHSV